MTEVRRTAAFGVDLDSGRVRPSTDPETAVWLDQFLAYAKSGVVDPGTKVVKIPIKERYRARKIYGADGDEIVGEARDAVRRVMSFSAGRFALEERVDVGQLLEYQFAQVKKSSPRDLTSWWTVSREGDASTGRETWTATWTMRYTTAAGVPTQGEWGFVLEDEWMRGTGDKGAQILQWTAEFRRSEIVLED
jgi:hypothetical protein